MHKERLVDRLIDAICWFGDARKEQNIHAQVVKIVTSLERLASFESEKDSSQISENFASRISSLIGLYHHQNELWYKRVKKTISIKIRSSSWVLFIVSFIQYQGGIALC